MANQYDRTGNGYDIATAGDPPPRAHIYDYLIVLARHRWKIIAFVLVGLAVITTYLLVQPQTYSATATLMPPEQQKGVSLSDMIGKGTGLDFQSIGKNSSAEIFVKMLGSRTLMDSLIDRFELIKRYGLQPGQRELARQRLSGELESTSDRDGIITISFGATTGFLPSKSDQLNAGELSASVVNGAITLLDQMNREKNISSARRSREFIGRMRSIKRKERDAAQEKLLRYQQNNNVIGLDQQVKASVTALAEIEGNIQKAELELRGAQTDLTASTGVIRALEARMRQLREQKARIASGGATGGLSIGDIPELAKEYSTLMLDLEVATEVYTYLEAQYHQEEVQEARDLPTVNALDPAIRPETRSAPRRGVTLLIAFPILLIMGIFGAFIYEALRRQAVDVDSDRAAALRDALARRKRMRGASPIDESRN